MQTDLLARWESEADDPEWTRNQEAVTTALFELFQLSRQSLLEVDCRASVCRLEIEGDELSQLKALSQHLQEGRYPVSYSLPSEGGALVAYVAREGMEREVLGEHFAAVEDAPP